MCGICDEHDRRMQREATTCKRCGHPADWHRFDGAQPWAVTDPRGNFRCIGYDCEVGGKSPLNPCQCPDFVSEGAAHE